MLDAYSQFPSSDVSPVSQQGQSPLRSVYKFPDSIVSADAAIRELVGQSPRFLSAINIARRVAPSCANILITGESGTGKEVFAQFIHQHSKHQRGPYVAINCSAIPEHLLESELFGHSKGSFTGALDKRVGLFEAAENGTLFLDEIGDLSLCMQAKLLRALQEKRIKRVGENQDRSINCRIISATHKDLALEVRNNRFREDLFFRLNVIPIAIPALRERPEDLLALAEHFLSKFAAINGSAATTFSEDAARFIETNEWRGNVRELQNAIERAVVLCEGSEILLSHFMPELSFSLKGRTEEPAEPHHRKEAFCFEFTDQLPTVEEVVNRYILFAVEHNDGAKDKTAKEIGIDRKTLYKRTRLELERET